MPPNPLGGGGGHGVRGQGAMRRRGGARLSARNCQSLHASKAHLLPVSQLFFSVFSLMRAERRDCATPGVHGGARGLCGRSP